METAEIEQIAARVADNAAQLYQEIEQDEHSRFRSWEYCYETFYKARNDQKRNTDYLSLQLAFYLASWGMYRGSSFLLQKDYKIHIPVVEEVLKSKYDILLGADCESLLTEKAQGLLEELRTNIEKYYEGIRATVKEKNVQKSASETLVTKILLGTLGCVPAYDRNFKAGVRDTKVISGNFSKNSILQLAQFYQDNYEELEKTRTKFKRNGLEYPQMKLLDMGFWNMGKQILEK